MLVCRESIEPILSGCVAAFASVYREFGRFDDLRFRMKSDGSLFTDLERQIEIAVGAYLRSFDADWAVCGEEGYFHAGGKGDSLCWFIDPIDGTLSFKNGIDSYSFVCTLVEGGVPVAMVAHFPVGSSTYTAFKNGGAWKDGRRLVLRQETNTEHGIVAISDEYTFGLTELKNFLACVRNLPYVFRTYTDFFGHAMVAEGKCLAKIDAACADWDRWPAHLLTAEAGGSVAYKRFEPHSSDLSGSLISGDPTVVKRILDSCGQCGTWSCV